MPELTTLEEAQRHYAKCMNVSLSEAIEDSERIIKSGMRENGWPRDFAESTFIEDTESMTPEGLDAQEKQAAQAGTTKHKAKSVDAYGKTRTRTRKTDEIRIEIIKNLVAALEPDCDAPITITNEEREVSFKYNGRTFKIVLSEPRGPHKKKN